ncbi:MAG: O-antigen ligase family protein [Synergistaceae bacterium]|nr:O-antigen ligase family protein [Synergistaceae bacterium]
MANPVVNKKSKAKIKHATTPAQLLAPLPLVPAYVVVPLWFVSLALPNLVYSGIYWYDTLHIMKFFVAGVPVGIAALVAGVRLALYGGERFRLRFDPFAALWFALLAYSASQALFLRISSYVSFTQELLCFSAVWAFYVVSLNSFPNRAIRPLLWLANVNAAINVLFAELQIRDINGVLNVGDFFRPILPTPFNYIGNTGQQNMFGLWMAVCVMSSVYLYIAYATLPDGRKRHPAVTVLNLVLMGVNCWGLWSSTSRSAILSLAVGLALLAFVTLRCFGKEYTRRLWHVAAVLGVILAAVFLMNYDRAWGLVAKTLDMVEHSETYGGRDGIWATSRTMFKSHPVLGVGIGQYKWHYMEAQREMFNSYPHKRWQYTHWAHNEFLQWFCESGAVGGTVLLLMWGVWGFRLLKRVKNREDMEAEVIWACALVALVSFNAFWTRPFHRIENILWLSLAFAVSNRGMDGGRVWSILSSFFSRLGSVPARTLGAALAAGSCAGFFFLGDGMVGDRMIREALSTRDAVARQNLLERASTHFMASNDALKNLGYFYLQVGQQTQNPQTAAKGLQLIWEHFLKEPHSEDMGVLIDWAQRFQNVDILNILASYLKPGTYSLDVKPATTSDGNTINAVVLRQFVDPDTLPEASEGKSE